MALKTKFQTEAEIPASHRALYVERDGAWVLDVDVEESSRRLDATSWRVPLPVEVPREKRTLRQFAEAAEENQKLIGLESEVRRLAKEQNLDRAQTNQLVERARCSWRVVNGDLLPVAGDRQTVLLTANGERVLSIGQWFERSTSPRPSPQRGEGVDNLGRGGSLSRQPNSYQRTEEENFPMRNPFRRKTWNLTEQMKLQRRDSVLAKRLKAEAWAAAD